MTFAYNPPPRRRRIAERDADDVEGIFDTITSAVDTVSKAVSTGSKVASTVGAAAAPIVSAARQVVGRPQARPAPTRAAMPVRSSSAPLRVQTFAPMPTRVLSETTPAAEPQTSHAVPIAIGTVAIIAAGGGALWYFTRKDGRRASHR